ncbi:hypothetical protein MANY_39390 [Mycolicibacterium anyangense]|uniref:DUF732 domain-containing protein n=2 Tax=Mycolicibacterium anyangense TaxID=1431246 RepID=A0A6N4WF92_9MYCO|nr:hypothetical protein MANY_39390 [Mycolicibacterium anyangense]
MNGPTSAAMWKTLAAAAVVPMTIVLAAQAQATPANTYEFLKQLGMDGLKIDGQAAIQDGYDICRFMKPPDGGALWDAAKKVRSEHPDWTIDQALLFSTRATQFICPDRESFPD